MTCASLPRRTKRPTGSTYGHNYENQRFSTLDQINRDNVTRLVPRWIYRTGISATFLASPVVADGVMYLSTPRNDVVAVDAVTGVEKWRYRHRMKIDKLCCGPANRGVSIGYGAVYMASADARLIALDMETGAVKWDIFMAVPDEDRHRNAGGPGAGRPVPRSESHRLQWPGRQHGAAGF